MRVYPTMKTGVRRGRAGMESLEQRQLLSALLNVRMVVNGGANDGASSLQVATNQTVNFKIVARLAPLGTVNNTKGQKITSLVKSTDGIAQVRFNVQQSASDQIKADFTSPVTLLNGFNTATYSSSGTLAARGSTGLHNLNSVKAVQPFGTFVGVSGSNTSSDVVLATGSFVVKSLGTGSSSNIVMNFSNPDLVPGGLKINGGQPVAAFGNESDPIMKFSGLTLTKSGTTVTGSISGTVFSDDDKDGVIDANEAKLGSRKIYIDANANGKFDSGEKSVLSNSSGVYTFTGLAAGTYRIGRADLPAGYFITTPVGGFHIINLSAGQVVTGKNIGAAKGTSTGTTGSISGRVFNDTNKNGAYNTGETLLATRKVYIDANKNGKLDIGEKSVFTNASGVYSFTGLAAGTYVVRRADLPAGYKITTPLVNVTLAAGQKVANKDIGAALI